MFRTDAQSIFTKDFGNFCHRSGRFESEVAHNHECFVHQDARSLFQFPKRNARIDIAIIISAPDYDVRRIVRRGAEEGAYPVRGRSHFLNDFLELLDHSARFEHRLLLIENLRAQIQQVAPKWIARRQRRNNAIKRIEEIARARILFLALKPFAALVAHLWFGSIRRTECHYSFVRRIPQSSTLPTYKTFNHHFDLALQKKME